jgi:hypothetical protein
MSDMNLIVTFSSFANASKYAAVDCIVCSRTVAVILLLSLALLLGASRILSVCVATNGGMTTSDVLEMRWQEVVVA